jgi:hypothetical protein
VNRSSRGGLRRLIVIIMMLLALAGCGTATATGPQQPVAQIERAGPHGVPSVVLSPLGAQRIGVQIARAAPAGGHPGQAVVPYSALLYEPDGTTVIYTVTGWLTYTRVTVSVASIQDGQVDLTGLGPGTAVVTVGGEELLGVQDGVGVQT